MPEKAWDICHYLVTLVTSAIQRVDRHDEVPVEGSQIPFLVMSNQVLEATKQELVYNTTTKDIQTIRMPRNHSQKAQNFFFFRPQIDRTLNNAVLLCACMSLLILPLTVCRYAILACS